MLKPIKDIGEYSRIKQTLRDKFDSERTGEQHLFIEQSKLLQPLIEPLIATQQTVKAIQERPLPLRALRYPLAALQAAGSEVTSLRSTAESGVKPEALESKATRAVIKIDLDSGLAYIDIRNLQDMNFGLPSEVFQNKQIEETLNKIKTENRSIGQKLGKGSDATEKDKEIYRSWKETLEIYRQKILGLEGAKQFVGKGMKTDVIFYPSVEDLCMRLTELDAARQAGNTGLDNSIISVLDELLRTQAISKDVYDDLYKIIFP
jgi:hypothetical protein